MEINSKNIAIINRALIAYKSFLEGELKRISILGNITRQTNQELKNFSDIMEESEAVSRLCDDFKVL